MATTPLLEGKAHDAPSEFRPENLLREARRQKSLQERPIPRVCLLDPDGDVVRMLKRRGTGRVSDAWACYHTDLYEFEAAGEVCGVVGCAVGSSFAVLIAEQMFQSGCELLISITSSGQIVSAGPTPYFVLIERALRDEGTSYHYLPPSEFSELPAAVREGAARLLGTMPSLIRGATWTTDAPFRETRAAIERAEGLGILAVEMEAAALYAFGTANRRRVLCFAHVTNQMAREPGDFEKGEDMGAHDALDLFAATVRAFRTEVGA